MIPTSAAYKQAVQGSRKFESQVSVTFADGTERTWSNANLLGLQIEEATSNSGTFDLGAAIIGKLSLDLLNLNDEYSEQDFVDAKIQVKIGLAVTSGTEYLNKGYFTVDTARASENMISITALDNMSKLDCPYQANSTLIYPATLLEIYRDVCTIAGAVPGTTGFPNDSYVVPSRPTEDYTCREILSAVATLAGSYSKADRNGQIVIGWYDGLKDYDGGIFDNGTPLYQTGDDLDGGEFDFGRPYFATGDNVDGGDLSSFQDYFHLYSASSQEIDVDDIRITGVSVAISIEDNGQTQTQTYLVGEEGYVISISDNPLLQYYQEAMLQALADQVVGMTFRKFTMTGRADPSLETGDIGFVSDRKGNAYITALTSLTFTMNGYESYVCDAESISEKNALRYDGSARTYTKILQKAEDMVQEEKTAREAAIEQLTNRVNNSSGLYTTIETQSDGSQIFKLHDKPTLEESQIVWTMTAEAWTVSTNGGETPNAGMTVDGDTIVRILTATGINADWINSGTIRAINIVGSTISGAEIVGGTIRTATIEGYVDDDTFNEEIETVLDDIGALQEQSDKKAETWYQSSDPSTAWTTTTLKQEHTGDIWYNTSVSVQKSYRWNGSTWQEMKTSPPDEVFDEIDGKAQIFVSQPSPPYAVGDLWFNSTTSDIMTCINSRTSGSYSASDWQKRNKYTDDTAANAAQQTANSALNSASSASTLANQAKSAADTANANANQASQMAAAVRQDLAVSGAVEINGGNIKSDTVNAMLVDAGVLVGLVISNGNGTFYVDAQGNLTANSADISGKIEADEGRIGSLIINSHGFKSNTVEIQDNPGDPLIWLTMALDGSWSRSNYEADAAVLRTFDQKDYPTGWTCYLMSADRSFGSDGTMHLTPNPKLEFTHISNNVYDKTFLLNTTELSYKNTDLSDISDAFFEIRFGGANILFASGDMFVQSAMGSGYDGHVYINGTPF